MTAEKIKDFVYKVAFYADYTPKAFGLFLLAWFLVTLVGVIIVIKAYDKKLLKKLYLISAIILWVGEIYKQLVLSFVTGKFSYQWYHFPLQIFSTPLYTYVIALVCKKGKLYDWLGIYHGVFSTVAGLTVMIVPTTVFSPFMGINVQSALHCSIMIIVGACALRAYAKNLSPLTFLGGFCVFAFFLALAVTYNWAIPILTSQPVNMYFIGNSVDLHIPIISSVKEAFPYPFFVFTYILAFTEISTGVAYLSYKIANKKRKY